MIIKIFNKLTRLYKVYILRDEFLISARRWFKDQGDTTLRLNYPLDENSVVFDLGGYKGDFTAEISNRYNCRIFLFEPSPAFYKECHDRFINNKKITCFNFGLSSESQKALLSNNENSSSTKLTKDSCSGYATVELVSFSEFLEMEEISNIDLLKINIEGGEYDIMPHIVEKNLVQKINYLQIQFHNFIENSEESRNEIISKLKRTHQPQWCYPFVWESWKRKV